MYIYTVRVLYTPSPPQMCFYIVYHLESFRGHKKPKAKISPRSQWVVSHPRVGDVVVHCVKSFQRMMGLSFPLCFLLCFDGFGISHIEEGKVSFSSIAWGHTDCICSLCCCIPSSFFSVGKMHLIWFEVKGIWTIFWSRQKGKKKRLKNIFSKLRLPPPHMENSVVETFLSYLILLLLLSKSSRFPLLGICIVCRFYLRSESHDIIVGFHSPFSL